MALSFGHGGVILLLVFVVSMANAGISIAGRMFDVTDFGAVADGKTDSAQAVLRAWNEACAAVEGGGRVVVPRGTFLVGPLVLMGPCRGPMQVHVKGLIRAPVDLAVFQSKEWILFKHVDRLTVFGGGVFDGRGAAAWPHNQCSKSWDCDLLPSSIKLSYVTNSTIRDVASINSKFFHFIIHSSAHIRLDHLTIAAPERSPNTDGVHVATSTDVTITRSAIATGDDCVSVGPGSRNITVSGVLCGPGHGISVGSLGKYLHEDDVVGLRVSNCTLVGTTNGARIKTWPASPESSASEIVFEDIVMKDVKNPIIIDQEYCPYAACNKKLPSMVRLSKIGFRNIRGVSATKVAVNMRCSAAAPCQDVELTEIDLKYHGKDDAALASCSNVHGVFTGHVNPPPCF